MSVVAPEINLADKLEHDEDKIAHIIKKADWEKAYIMGELVQALCGKMWVPHRDPQGLPTCSRCVEVFKELSGQNFG